MARHYINPDDERAIQGAAQDEIEGFYEREESKVPDGGLVRDPSHALLKKGFDQVEEEDIRYIKIRANYGDRSPSTEAVERFIETVDDFMLD